MGLTTKEKWE